MKIPLSWLKEFIDLNESPAEIAKTLTLAGLEVDAIVPVGASFSNVVVAEVLEVEKHPNADQLVVAKVSDGASVYQVVCGAPNCRPQMKTALALVDAVLEEEDGKKFKIKRSKLRGVESFGMLCSSSELKLGQDADGIMEFEPHILVGQDLQALYADTVFEISLTPNLGHCSSVLGVARELAAAYHLPLKLPKIDLYEDDFTSIEKETSVLVEEPLKTLRYACRLVKDVTVSASPKWLQDKLALVGIRSINNIVDITNYVMLAVGNPLHAFDFDTLEDKKIIIKGAVKDEPFVTLDEENKLLQEDDLVIQDSKKSLAIAGVMGGLNSAISEKTKNVLIEAACFLPSTVRKSSKRLGIQTDSSKRFERGIDPNSVPYALDLAASLMQKLATGKVVKGAIDIKQKEFAKKTVRCRLSRINDLLGTHLSVSEVEPIFKRLEMDAKIDGKSCFTVEVPTYRNDISEEIDLVEEVARIYGYNNIPKVAPRYKGSTLPHSPIYLFEKDVRTSLLQEGLQEFLTCDLIGPVALNTVGGSNMEKEAVVQVLNPTSIEQSVLRTSLLPGILQSIKYNIAHQNRDISCFEIGRIHFKNGDKYLEHSVAAIALTGKKDPHSVGKANENVDFYDLKGILENLFEEFGIQDISFKESQLRVFHDARQASIFAGELEIGSMGEIHPAVQRKLDVTERILFAEISLHDLYPLKKTQTKMALLPLYPNSVRDWTVTLNENITYAQVLKAIYNKPFKFLEKVSLIDIYRSDKLGKGLKNMTLRFTYRDRDKTILQEDVDAEHGLLTQFIVD